jgi:hypothetical protein
VLDASVPAVLSAPFKGRKAVLHATKQPLRRKADSWATLGRLSRDQQNASEAKGPTTSLPFVRLAHREDTHMQLERVRFFSRPQDLLHLFCCQLARPPAAGCLLLGNRRREEQRPLRSLTALRGDLPTVHSTTKSCQHTVGGLQLVFPQTNISGDDIQEFPMHRNGPSNTGLDERLGTSQCPYYPRLVYRNARKTWLQV